MIAGSHINGYLAHPQHAEIVAVCDTVDANVKRRAADFLSVATSNAESATAEAEKAETVEAREQLKADAALLSEYANNGVKIFSDYNEMIKVCDLDAVSLALPPVCSRSCNGHSRESGDYTFSVKSRWRAQRQRHAICAMLVMLLALNSPIRAAAHASTQPATPFAITSLLEKLVMSTTADLQASEFVGDLM